MTQYNSLHKGKQVDLAISQVLEGVTKSQLFKSDIGFITSSASGTIEELEVSPLDIELVDGDLLSIYQNDLGLSLDAKVSLNGVSSLPPGSTQIPVTKRDGDPLIGDLEQGDPLYLGGISLASRLNNINNTIGSLSGQISDQSGAIIASLTVGGVAFLNQEYAITDNTTQLEIDPLMWDLEQGDILFVRDRDSLDLITMEVGADAFVGDTTITLEDPVNFTASEGDVVSLAAESFASRMIVIDNSIDLLNSEVQEFDGRIDLVESGLQANSNEISLYSSRITDLENDRDQAFSRLTLTENSIDQLVVDVGDNYSQITQTAGRISTLIERGLGTSKITRTSSSVSQESNIPVESTRFSLYEGDQVIFIDADQGTEFYRTVQVDTPSGSTNIHINSDIPELSGHSSVVLDTKFVRSKFTQQANLLSNTISELGVLEADLSQAQDDLSTLTSDFTQTASSLESSIVSTQLSSAIGRITSSLDGTYNELTVVDLEAILQDGDELHIVNQATNNVYKVIVDGRTQPGAQVTVSLDDDYALETEGTSYVLLRLSKVSSNISQTLDNIELSLNQISNLDGRVSSNESAITLQQDEINLRVTETQYRDDLAGQSLGLIDSVDGNTITLVNPLTFDLFKGDRILIREESGQWDFEILDADALAGTNGLVIEGNAEDYSTGFSTVMLDKAGPKTVGSQLTVFLDSIEADTNLFKHSSFDGDIDGQGRLDLGGDPYGTMGWALGMDSDNNAILVTHNIYARGIIQGDNLEIDTNQSKIDLGNIKMRGESDGYIQMGGTSGGDPNLTIGPGLAFATLDPESQVMDEDYPDEIGIDTDPSFGVRIKVLSPKSLANSSLPIIFTCDVEFDLVEGDPEHILELRVQGRPSGTSFWETVASTTTEEDQPVSLTGDVTPYEDVRLYIRFATDGDHTVDIKNMNFAQYNPRTVIREDGIYMTVAPGIIINMLSGGGGGAAGGGTAPTVTRDTLGIDEDDEVTFAKVITTNGAEFGDDVTISGDLFATNKHFRIPDKDNPGSTITYSSLEGNQNAVFFSGHVRGSKHAIIELPREWRWLVDLESLVVNLTCRLGHSNLAYEINPDRNQVDVFELNGLNFHASYIIIGTRKDIEPLQVYS